MTLNISAEAPARPRALASLWSGLGWFWRQAEPIDVVDQRFNFLPDRFRWRGDLRRVRSVARIWEQPARGIRPARRYFEVICGSGQSFVLFQDIRIGTWHMSV